jgi:hypothetical protein
MNAAISWVLVVGAFAVGYIGYGWRGVALAVTVTVFWMLLQFSRALRVLKEAGGNPVGQVPSAVMLHSKLQKGMRLPAVLKLTRSLGRRLDDAAAAGPESYAWADAGGDEVRVELRGGRVAQWELKRVAQPDDAPASAA